MQSKGFQMSRMVKIGKQWVDLDEYLNRKYIKAGFKAIIFYILLIIGMLAALQLCWGE